MQSALAGPLHIAGNASGAATVSATMGGPPPAHLAGGAPPAKLQNGDAAVHLQAAQAAHGEQNVTGTATVSSSDAGHRTLVSTPKVLEVGIASGTQGWVKVRAELGSDGVVNASLSTASQAGQEMLHRELPSLTAYLQQERVTVNAVVVHATAADPRAASGMNGGAGGQMQQQGRANGGERGASERMAAGQAVDGGLDVAVAGESLLTLHYAGVGGWLSVRA